MSASHRAQLAALLFVCTPLASAQTVELSDANMLAIDDVAITPDQHYAVVRENNCTHFARIYDLTSFTLASTVPGDCQVLAGECTDAVAVTDTRAVVLGGSVAQILDLTAVSTAPLIATRQVGIHPRDLAITPDGTIVVVRGGSSQPNFTGGQYLFELAGGTQIAFAPGEPTPYPAPSGSSFGVDDVEVTNSHAVVTSYLSTAAGPTTRVTIWELHPQGGGAPVVAYETTPCQGCGDQAGAPYDLAISPDGSKAVVRSELVIGAYDLSVSPPALLWQHRPHAGTGYFAEEALDAVVAGDQHIVTLSRVAQTGGAQADVFDWAGLQWWNAITGSPHDLVLTPDETRALVRTNANVALYDLANLPAPGPIVPASQAASVSGVVGYFAGFDSIAADDDYAVTLARIAGQPLTRVEFWDIRSGTLGRIAETILADNRPTDVEIVPGGTRAVVSGNAGLGVYDLETGTELLHHNAVPSSIYWGWCDGVAVTGDKAVAVGMVAPQQGWVILADLAPFESPYCIGAPNSSGAGASITAGGEPSLAAGSIELLVAQAPARVPGRFAYGTQTSQLPFGAGFQCLAGSMTALPLVWTNSSGAVAQSLDFAQHPAVQAGATLHFQFIFRDPATAQGTFNLSNGMTVVFTP
jgi:hypothetical protein